MRVGWPEVKPNVTCFLGKTSRPLTRRSAAFAACGDLSPPERGEVGLTCPLVWLQEWASRTHLAPLRRGEVGTAQRFRVRGLLRTAPSIPQTARRCDMSGRGSLLVLLRGHLHAA